MPENGTHGLIGGCWGGCNYCGGCWFRAGVLEDAARDGLVGTSTALMICRTSGLPHRGQVSSGGLVNDQG